MTQRALFCPCGAKAGWSGLCRPCQRKARLSRKRFNGERDLVLDRDSRACRVCGEGSAELVLVHHRKPGVDRGRWFLVLCRRCHARVHNAKRIRYVWPELEKLLWRELNPHVPEQGELPLGDRIFLAVDPNISARAKGVGC